MKSLSETVISRILLKFRFASRTFIIWRMDGRFYGLNFKKDMVVVETRHRYARFKKTPPDSMAKRKKLGSTRGLLG